MAIKIKSTNYSGQTANITFTPDTGGTQSVTGVVIPYTWDIGYINGDYDVLFTAFNKTCELTVADFITPTSMTQFTNVILTANKSVTWALTDFYGVTGNTITSFVGTTLPEGYFSTTGGTVSIDSASQSITIASFDPSDVSSAQGWYDLSDTSTVNLRTDLGVDYVTSVDNKITGGSIGLTALQQPSASLQWVYDDSTYFTAGSTTPKVGISTTTSGKLYTSETWDQSWKQEVWSLIYIGAQVGASVLPYVGSRDFPQSTGLKRFGGQRRRSDSSPGFRITARGTNVWEDQYDSNGGNELGAYSQSELVHTSFDGTNISQANGWFSMLQSNQANIEYNFTGYTGSTKSSTGAVANEFPFDDEPFEIFRNLDGEVVEVFATNDTVSDTDRLSVNRYFYHKYDLGLYSEQGNPNNIPIVDL